MNCEVARQALLEADPDALSASGNGALADHLRTCPKCARMAALLNEGHTQLAAHLDEDMVNPPAALVDEVLQRSRAPSEVAKERRERLFSVGRRALAPLLAAAAIAGLMLWSNEPLPSPRSVATPDQTAPAATPRIEAPAGKSVAVIQTRNPSITVVWLFSGGD
jgi:predicted anti-sigma-YlaC factor YlaD